MKKETKFKIKSCIAIKDGTLQREFVFKNHEEENFTINVSFHKFEKFKYYIHSNTKHYVVMKDRGGEPYPYAVPDELWLSKSVFNEYFSKINDNK